MFKLLEKNVEIKVNHPEVAPIPTSLLFRGEHDLVNLTVSFKINQLLVFNFLFIQTKNLIINMVN